MISKACPQRERFQDFPSVPMLESFRAFAVCEPDAPTRLDQKMRVMLSVLGLGLEQTLSHVTQVRPSREALEHWIIQTAGLPDPDELARYVAMVEGTRAPEAVRQRLAGIEAMAPVLDASDLAGWERDGYVVLRQAIDREQVAATADLVWRIAGASREDPGSWYANRAQGIMLGHYQSAEQEAARRSPRIHKAFAQLWGTADLWPSIDRLGFSPPVTKSAPFRASPLHWDCSLSWPIPFNMFGVLYLSDTRADQGAFRLVPGFHHGLQAWLEAQGDQDPRQIDLTGKARYIEGQAGDLIICRHDLPHGASPNHAERPRLVQYLTMFPSWFREQDEWR